MSKNAAENVIPFVDAPAPVTVDLREELMSTTPFARLKGLSQALVIQGEEYSDEKRIAYVNGRSKKKKSWIEARAAKIVKDHETLIAAANAAVASVLKKQAVAWGEEMGIPTLTFSFDFLAFFHHLWLRNLNRKRGYKDFQPGKVSQWRPYRVAMRLEDAIALVGMEGVESVPLDGIKSEAEEAGFPERRVRDVVGAVKAYRQYLATLNPTTLNMFSMFAGMGGMETAAKLFGPRIRSVGVAEIEKYQGAVLKSRFPNVKNWGNVKEIDWVKVLNEIAAEVHVLTAGFPCQDISIAGKHKGFAGKRSVLFFEIIRAIKILRPRYVILENVRALLHKDQRETLKAVIRAMGRAGYVLDLDVLDPLDDGLPMSRERVYAVAIRKDLAKHLPRCVAHRKPIAERVLAEIGYKGVGGFLSGPSVSKPSWLGDVIEREFDPALLLTETQRANSLDKLQNGKEVEEMLMFASNDNVAASSLPDVIMASSVTNTLHYRGRSFGMGGGGVRPDVAYTFTTSGGFIVAYEGIVRFLSVSEMERLMGYEVGYTAVAMGKREASRGKRIEALGNGMAVPSAARALQAVLIMEYFAAAA